MKKHSNSFLEDIQRKHKEESDRIVDEYYDAIRPYQRKIDECRKESESKHAELEEWLSKRCTTRIQKNMIE